MFWGLLIAVVAAIFAHTRGGLLINGFTDPKIIIITAGIVAAWYWRDGKVKIPNLYYAAIAYCVSIFPSLSSSKDYAISIFGYPGVYSGGALTTGLCASGVVLSNRLPDKQKETIRRVILSSGALIAILLVAQKMGHDPLRFPLFGNKPVGIQGSGIDSGALMVTMLSASLNPIYMIGALASGTRGVLIGAVVSLFPVRMRTCAFVVATVAGIAWTSVGQKNSDCDRRMIWDRAASNVSILGSGPATFHKIGGDSIPVTRTINAHNSILEAAATRGFFGLLGLLALLVAPQMAGLWTVCMFNPVSFEVVFIACVIVGITKQRR